MDMYVYELRYFNFEDEYDEDDEYCETVHRYTHIAEAKLKNFLPMAYGYFYFGWNYIEIYPYDLAAFPIKPISIFNGEENTPLYQNYSLVLPYQNKRMAKDIFSKWLEALGYKKAAESVRENDVTHIKSMEFPIARADITVAKRWDKKKIDELMKRFVERYQEEDDR